MSEPLVIDARGLVREFRVGAETVVRALDQVDLHVAQGELVALLGVSGSGKSTLLSILGCLDRPDAGTYHLDGEAVNSLDDAALAKVRNRRIGFVFQQFNLLDELTAQENVALPLRYSAVPRHERLDRAGAALDALGLGSRLSHRPRQLSGGQQQRVAIARALVTQPALLLADEPTGNLDSASSAAILEVLGRLHDEGRTIVIVTHDPGVASVAQRAVRLADGRVVHTP